MSERPEEPAERSRRFSLEGRIGLAVVATLALFVLADAALERWASLPAWLAPLLAFGATFPLGLWSARLLLRPVSRTLSAVADGIRSFRDRDFSVRITTRREDELGDLIRQYNLVGAILQEERAQLRQRELLLQAALEHSPLAIVLVNPLDRVVYANLEARRTFLGGQRLGGLRFSELVAACPPEMKQVLDEGSDGVFSTASGTEGLVETYHLSHRRFRLNRRPHRLILLRRMTPELARQEAEIWKRVIRVISHELNNSLAPIASLAHSATLVARQPSRLGQIESLHDAIRERVAHLTRFLEGYARYARLPAPRKQRVEWGPWLEAARGMFGFEIEGDLPGPAGWFDPAQMQQVLINLLKNAVEASDGQPCIAITVTRLPDGSARVQVLDRGRGMTEDVMRQALLPFYSTKPAGSGVGLPLCREIVEAHGGTLRIQARPGGGTIVSFRLPAAPG